MTDDENSAAHPIEPSLVGTYGWTDAHGEPGTVDIGLRRGNRIFGLGHLGMLRRLSCLQVFYGGLGTEKIRLGLRHPRPIIAILDLDQQLALLDPLKIIHGHPAYITLDLGAQRRDVAALAAYQEALFASARTALTQLRDRRIAAVPS